MRRDDWLLAQLPVGMTEDDFLARFVAMFQHISDTVLHHVDNLGHLADVAVAPAPMVREIGRWFGLDWVDSSLPDELQRQLVRRYANGLIWRGTRAGLQTLLQAVTGAPVTIHDSGGVFPQGEAPNNPPHIIIEVSASSWASDADLLRIVRLELPATVTFELLVDGRPMIGTAA